MGCIDNRNDYTPSTVVVIGRQAKAVHDEVFGARGEMDVNAFNFRGWADKDLSADAVAALEVELCDWFKEMEEKDFERVQSLSLEAQMWWRDHQKRDADRISKEEQAELDAHDTQVALDKLTNREEALLRKHFKGY